MTNPISMELQLQKDSSIYSQHKTIGDLRKSYPNLKIIKYIFLDPTDGKLKGRNPPDALPIVQKAYITVLGSPADLTLFAKDATKD